MDIKKVLKAINNIAEIAIDEVQKTKAEQENTPQKVEVTTPVNMNLKKTLPENIEELLSDDEALKAALLECEPNAYGGYEKGNIFHYVISEDMIKWCLERGSDINYVNYFDSTPLMYHAGSNRAGATNMALLLIKYGADIFYKNGKLYRKTALYYAAEKGKVELVEALIAKGAVLDDKDANGWNPLEAAFSHTHAGNLSILIPVTHLLLDKGIPITDVLKKRFIEMAKELEFRRSDWIEAGTPPERMAEMDAAYDGLYELFDVERVPRRVMYDGKSKITVKSTTWQKQHDELWDLLVPASGHASTIQGEVTRISGKLSYEILDNGSCNWDSNFRVLVNALKKYLKMGEALSDEENAEVAEIAKDIQNKYEDELDRLTELCVKWVLQNPMPIKAEGITYIR